MSIQKKGRSIGFVALTIAVMGIFSCDKFVDIDPPKTDLISETVFESENTATAAIIDIYYSLTTPSSFSSGGLNSFSFRGALSADELDLYGTNPEWVAYYDNSLLPATMNSSIWSGAYQIIYKANSVLEGASSSSSLSGKLKARLIGEAKFLRSFCYFYLVNLFGDVPLVINTDYRTNSMQARVKKETVYEQILIDLAEASELLDSSYLALDNITISVERNRVNRFSAIALLARVNLFLKNWAVAERLSTEVINASNLYSLVPLNGVFKKNSREAIWQLSRDNGNALDAGTFVISITTGTPPNGAIKESFYSSFDANDQRKSVWLSSKKTDKGIFRYPLKYTTAVTSPITEYSTVLRLAEQYLIRAEARINQEGKVQEGISDLNAIRGRASMPVPNSLSPLSFTLTKSEAVLALETEKNHEFFSEWGHRWLDLKRWPSIKSPADASLNRADDELPSIKIKWKKEWKLYPIPEIQIKNNPAMSSQQNPGYN